MKNLLDLARDLQKITRVPAELANRKKIAWARAVIFYLVYETPVDTSKALSNWGLSIKSVGAYRDAYVAGAGGSTRDPSAEAAIAAAEAVLKRVRPGQVLTLFNSAPYIQRLNDGYSKQAPAGFIEKSFIIGQRAAEGQK